MNKFKKAYPNLKISLVEKDDVPSFEKEKDWMLTAQNALEDFEELKIWKEKVEQASVQLNKTSSSPKIRPIS